MTVSYDRRRKVWDSSFGKQFEFYSKEEAKEYEADYRRVQNDIKSGKIKYQLKIYEGKSLKWGPSCSDGYEPDEYYENYDQAVADAKHIINTDMFASKIVICKVEGKNRPPITEIERGIVIVINEIDIRPQTKPYT
jgi:hypothetical protein